MNTRVAVVVRLRALFCCFDHDRKPVTNKRDAEHEGRCSWYCVLALASFVKGKAGERLCRLVDFTILTGGAAAADRSFRRKGSLAAKTFTPKTQSGPYPNDMESLVKIRPADFAFNPYIQGTDRQTDRQLHKYVVDTNRV